MLTPIRQGAGLGTPPTPFYTNAVESINSLLKLQTDHRKQELPIFIERLKNAMETQFMEVDRAIAGLGDYQVLDGYRSFQFSAAKWCQLNVDQRKRVLSKFKAFRPLSSSCCNGGDLQQFWPDRRRSQPRIEPSQAEDHSHTKDPCHSGEPSHAGKDGGQPRREASQAEDHSHTEHPCHSGEPSHVGDPSHAGQEGSEPRRVPSQAEDHSCTEDPCHSGEHSHTGDPSHAGKEGSLTGRFL